MVKVGFRVDELMSLKNPSALFGLGELVKS